MKSPFHAACLAVLVAFTSATAVAAPRRARLTVDVKAEGSERVVGNGSDQASAKFREGWTIVTFFETDGELAQFNTKDPQYAQKMMGMAQGVQAQVNKAQGKAPAKKMSQQQIQEYVQKKQAACGTNQDCLMKLATEAQELMMNMDAGGATAAGNAGAYTGDEPPRYLNYFGFDNCGATTHVHVDRTTQGTYGDVQGAVPYTVVDKADYRSDANEIRLICNAHSLVIDTQDDTFFMDALAGLSPKGTSTKTVGGKTETSTGEAPVHGDYQTWVLEQLRHAPRSGTRNTTVKLTTGPSAALHAGRYSGQANVTLTWRLEDVK
jgi:hypothetical protein